MLIKLKEPIAGIGERDDVVLIADKWVGNAILESGRGVRHKPERFVEVEPDPKPSSTKGARGRRKKVQAPAKAKLED